jgi:hypothetical protein
VVPVFFWFLHIYGRFFEKNFNEFNNLAAAKGRKKTYSPARK